MVTVCMPMPHECSILRPEFGEGDYGGTTVSRVEVAKNVKCFVQNAGLREISRFEKREMSIDTKIYFLTEPVLREGDFILISKNTKGTSYVGQSFEFKAIDDATAGHGIAWKAVCERESNPVEPIVG